MSNPIFSERAINSGNTELMGVPMTINGTINKTGFLLICLLMSAFCTWTFYFQGYMDRVSMLTVVGLVMSIVAFLVIMFNRKVISYFAPIYAVGEGLLLGGLTAMFEVSYPGIAMQAILGTFVTLGVMLMLYRMGVISATEKFRSILFVATLSIAGIYLIQVIGTFFLHKSIPMIFDSGAVGIGFSLFVVAIAALNLILDFDFIERGAKAGMDKTFEWYGAFGLMVTLVWLYMEILRLLAKLRDNR